jgi:hypothetical protein
MEPPSSTSLDRSAVASCLNLSNAAKGEFNRRDPVNSIRYAARAMGKSHLLNFAMHDGSRKFGELPQTVPWDRLRRHLEMLPGATVTNFITDEITEAWIDFSFRDQRLSVNNQFGDYWFFVEAPQAPDETLEAVLTYCRSLLGDKR